MTAMTSGGQGLMGYEYGVAAVVTRNGYTSKPQIREAGMTMESARQLAKRWNGERLPYELELRSYVVVFRNVTDWMVARDE